MGLGLGEEKSRDLALVAYKREHWAKRKFRKFLAGNMDSSVWGREDDLFKVPLEFMPRRVVTADHDVGEPARHSSHPLVQVGAAGDACSAEWLSIW